MRSLSIVLVFFSYFTINAQDMTYFYVESTGFTVTQAELQEANTLQEIHHRYEGKSVRTYIDTEISYTKNGFTTSAKGINNTLTAAQKELIQHAQVDGKLVVSVNYMPENTLSSNTPKNMDLFLEVIPHKLAQYEEGKDSFYNFIEENVVAKLDSTDRKTLQIAVLDFTVSKEGKVENVILEESTGNLEIDAMLQKSLCEMSSWNPAETIDGQAVAHSMRFYISNSLSNCLAYRGVSKE